jgi:hypothetical protein
MSRDGYSGLTPKLNCKRLAPYASHQPECTRNAIGGTPLASAALALVSCSDTLDSTVANLGSMSVDH